MSARQDRGQSGSQVSSWMPSESNFTPLAQTSYQVPHGLKLQQVIYRSGPVSIPAGITWVYCVLAGPGSASTASTAGGAGGVAWGWTIASNKAYVGLGISSNGGQATQNSLHTRYGHIIAGTGGANGNWSPSLGGGGHGSGGTGIANYFGMPASGGGANNTKALPGSGAGGGGPTSTSSPAGAGGDGLSGGGGGRSTFAGPGTITAGDGGNGLAGGGGGGVSGVSGGPSTMIGGKGGNGIGPTGIVYVGGNGTSGAFNGNLGAGGGGAGIAGNGGNASGNAGGAGGLGGGGAGACGQNSSATAKGGDGIIYLFY